MRPISVTLEGFGSYKNKVEFPLDTFGKDSLYLITGNTGAGKTTLFDAICFALYGVSSGGRREPEEMRFQNGEDEVSTSVELIFEVGGRAYGVRRYFHVVKSRKPKVDEEGNVLENQPKEVKVKAEFWWVNPMTDVERAPLVKPSDIGKKVEELLRLEKNQFTQIAMIPQGSFQDVLLKKSEERMKVLQRIFRTEKYEKVQSRLDKEVLQLQQEIKTATTELVRLEGSMEFLDVGERWVSDFWEHVQTGKVPQSEEVSLWTKVQEEFGRQLERHTEQGENALLELGVIRDYFTKLEDYKSLVKKREENDHKLKNQKTVIEKVELDKEKMVLFPQEIETLKVRQSEIKKQLDLLAQLEKDEQILKHKQEDVAKTLEKEATLQREMDTTREGLEQEKAYVKSCEGLDIQRTTLEQTVEATQERENQWAVLDVSLMELKKMEQKKQKAKGVYQKYSDGYQKAKLEQETQYKIYLDEQAGVLAEQLEEGKPCLVCGSLEHPNPAKKGVTAPTAEQLDELAQETEEKKLKWEEASRTAERVNLGFGEVLARVKEQGKQCLGSEEVEMLPNLLEKSRSNSTVAQDKALLLALVEQQQQWQKRKDGLPLWEQKLSTVLENHKLIYGKRVELETAVTEQGRFLEKQRATLQGFDGKALKEEQAQCERVRLEKETGLRVTEQGWTEALEQLRRLEGEAEGLAQGTDFSQELEKEEEYLQQREKWEQVVATSQDQTQKLFAVVQQNGKLLPQLADAVALVEKLEKRALWMVPLREAALGMENANLKMPFEIYVQRHYFDKVLLEANIALQEMNGRYEMICNEEKGDGKKVGLGISVLDVDTQVVRTGKTLSGGETFQASLALALGLSAVIAQTTQSPPVESLFLDEGFDALDGESLKLAVRTLEELAYAGRTIGIISHVEGLKEQIVKQVVIHKDHNGSKVKFVQ